MYLESWVLYPLLPSFKHNYWTKFWFWKGKITKYITTYVCKSVCVGPSHLSVCLPVYLSLFFQISSIPPFSKDYSGVPLSFYTYYISPIEMMSLWQSITCFKNPSSPLNWTCVQIWAIWTWVGCGPLIGRIFYKHPTLIACNFAASWATEIHSTSLERS